jgi:hypothetical protein
VIPIFHALCFAALAAAAPALASESAQPSITVTGAGQVSAAPDMAQVSAGVVTESPRAAEAVKATSAAMQRVLAALDAVGIEKKYVQTHRFDVSPVYADGSSRGGRPSIAGYRATNQVQVEVRGVDKVGAVLDALVGAGANELGGISFGFAEPAPLLDDARRKAIADARRKAELYAREAGVALGRVLDIDETGAGGGPVPVAYGRMMAESVSAPVAPGQLDLSASVTVTFAIAP